MTDERAAVASIVQCGAPRGDHAGWCDLQNDHGGNMHSGLIDGQRRWWDRKGAAVTFADRAAEASRISAAAKFGTSFSSVGGETPK